MNQVSYSTSVESWCQAHLAAIGDLLDLLDIPFNTVVGIGGIAKSTHAILAVTYVDPAKATWITNYGRIVFLNDELQSRHISIK